MNKQESYDFNQTHNWNVQAMARIFQKYNKSWLDCGKPQEANIHPVFHHNYIIMAGLIDRLW